MRFVLDASVTVTWCFRDEHNGQADVALDLLQSRAVAIAPMHWWFEIRNVITRGIRQKRVTEEDVAVFFHRLAATPVILAAIPDDQAIFAIARRHRLTFYDAAYLELAVRESIALATLDQALARGASAEGVALIGAS